MSGDRQNDLVDRAYRAGETATPAAAAGDRRGLIRALGGVQIVVGAICAGLLLLAVVQDDEVAWAAGITYTLAPATNLLITGIGSARIAPWARRATLVSATIWLALLGIAGAVLTSSRTGGSGYERFMIGAMLVVGLALAIVLVVVYTRPSVRTTFERRRAG